MKRAALSRPFVRSLRLDACRQYLRGRPAWPGRTSGRREVAGGGFARALVGDDLEADLLAFAQMRQARALDGADMDEYVLAAVLRLDEAKALLGVEPLDGSDLHKSFPCCAACAFVRRPIRPRCWSNRCRGRK